MKDLNKFVRAWRLRTRLWFERITSGEDGTASLSAVTRHNMRWFWLDGLFASASENIVVTYLVLYLLALGASSAQIGLLSALSSLSAALMLLPGAMLVERFGNRKRIALLNGVVIRLAIGLLALIPLALSGPAAVYAAIMISAIRDAASNLPYPAWISLTADIVPLSLRGRYFASRNMAMGIAAMAAVFLVGKLITATPSPLGYQIAFALAFLLGLAALFSFARLQDPQAQGACEKAESYSLRSLLSNLGAHPNFLALCVSAALWNFSLNVAGPFFNVYLVQQLKATAAQVGVLSIIASVSGLVVVRKVGELTDRWGARRVQMLSMLTIPILPVMWVFFRAWWHVIPLNILSGVLWTAHGLASFNFLLELTPPGQRARYSALLQLIVTLSLALGAAAGGVMVTEWGYFAVFLASGIGRMMAALIFTRFVRPGERLSEAVVPAT